MVVVLAAAFLSVSVDPAAAQPQDLSTGTVVSSELRFAPAGGSAPAGSIGARQRASLEDLRREDRESRQTYRSHYRPAQMSGQDWAPPPFEYDFILGPDECHEHADLAGRPEGWIKNHYAFCRIMKGEKVDVICSGGQCFPLRSTFRVTIIGYGSERDRTVRFLTYVDEITSTSPQLRDATFLKLDLECTAMLNPDDCVPDNRYPQEMEKSLSDWYKAPAYYTAFSSTAPVYTPENPNRLGYLDFWSKATVRVVGLPKSKPQSQESPRQKVRFDTVNYLNLNGHNAAIFSDVKPVIHFPVSRPEFAAMTESAAHYRTALDTPQLTIPRNPAKTIPGKVDGEPLTRWYFNNSNQNRAEAVKACIAEWGQNYTENGKYQCDEYPFNTTQEGAARGNGRFSVSRIPGDDNEAAGRWLGAWYSYDRILDNDVFHVDPTP